MFFAHRQGNFPKLSFPLPRLFTLLRVPTATCQKKKMFPVMKALAVVRRHFFSTVSQSAASGAETSATNTLTASPSLVSPDRRRLFRRLCSEPFTSTDNKRSGTTVFPARSRVTLSCSSSDMHCALHLPPCCSSSTAHRLHFPRVQMCIFW